MPRQIILNGTVANDGTGDNLRITANKINANFSELYGWLRVDSNGNLEIVAPGGDLILGDKTGNHINIPAKNTADPITIGDDNNPTIVIPSNNTSPVRISNENNPVVIGDDNCSSLNLPKCGVAEVAQLKNPNGPIRLGANGSPVIELPTPGSNSPLKITNPAGPIALGDPNAPAINVPSNAATPITIGKPSGPQISVPQNPENPTAPIAITNPTGPVNIGDPAAGAGVSVPPSGSSNPVKVTSPAGGVELGNPASGAGIDIPAAGSNAPTKVTGPAGGVELGNPTSGAGVSVPAAGSSDPLKVTNPTGPVNIGSPGGPGISVPAAGSNDPIKIGDQNSPSIVVPRDPTAPVQIGKPGQPVEVVTGLNKWELIYTGDNGKLDSSPFLKVTEDGEDSEGKSLHLHTALYGTGSVNSKLQSTIYFVDDVASPNRGGYSAESTDSKRAASLRFVKQSFGQGLILSPWANYNDTAFHNKGGVSVWRTTYGGNPATKVTLNDDAVGPSIHGLYLGSGAMSFFQDLAGGSSPNTAGLTYIVLPGIPDGSGVNKVGQVFANPYRNSGNPYFGFGWKQSTQLVESGGGQSGIEAAERVPGQEVLTWHTTNRVGVMNNNPNFTLSVTGDVAFTKTLRVGDNENAGTSGQFLTSTGTTTAPAWKTLSAGTGVTVSDTPSGPAIGVDNTIATKTYADNAAAAAAAALVDSAPATLDTLNELAAALGDDPNFATTLATNLGSKVPNTRTITAGSGLTGGGSLANDITISHADTSSAATLTASGRTYVTGLTFDTFGHVTAYTTGTETAPAGDTLFDAGTHTSGSTLALDRNNGTIQKVVLASNATALSIANIGVAQSFTIIFTQDGTGSRTLTTSSAFKFASGFKTLTTSANAVDMLNIFFDGSTYYCTLTTGYA
jgi:hypothetical protein